MLSLIEALLYTKAVELSAPYNDNSHGKPSLMDSITTVMTGKKSPYSNTLRLLKLETMTLLEDRSYAASRLMLYSPLLAL